MNVSPKYTAEPDDSKDIFEASSMLQKEILELQNQLKMLQMSDVYVKTDLSSLDMAEEGNNEDDGPKRDSNILQHNCKQLRAQLNMLKTGMNPYQPWFLGEEDVLKQLREQLKQTEECSSLLDVQRKELLKDADQEMKVSSELEELLKSAKQKVKTQGKKKRPNNSYEALEKKCTHMTKVNAELEKKLVAFTTQYCPLPDEETFKKAKKKLKNNGVAVVGSRDELLTLHQLVEQLVDAAVNDPNDPYVQTDHRHWPPYVEMLQRMDLVGEHPDDTNIIKMLPFYL